MFVKGKSCFVHINPAVASRNCLLLRAYQSVNCFLSDRTQIFCDFYGTRIIQMTFIAEIGFTAYTCFVKTLEEINVGTIVFCCVGTHSICVVKTSFIRGCIKDNFDIALVADSYNFIQYLDDCFAQWLLFKCGWVA